MIGAPGGFENVLESSWKVKGSPGRDRTDDGPEKMPKSGICRAKGISTLGPGLRETTRVAARVVEPEPSVATRFRGTPAPCPGAISSALGVPYNNLVLLSMESHLGGLRRLYVMGPLEEKVDGEKTKANGSPTRATGGTWELIGNNIIGLAVDSPKRSKAVAQATTGDAMVVTAKAPAGASTDD